MKLCPPSHVHTLQGEDFDYSWLPAWYFWSLPSEVLSAEDAKQKKADRAFLFSLSLSHHISSANSLSGVFRGGKKVKQWKGFPQPPSCHFSTHKNNLCLCNFMWCCSYSHKEHFIIFLFCSPIFKSRLKGQENKKTIKSLAKPVKFQVFHSFPGNPQQCSLTGPKRSPTKSISKRKRKKRK